MLFRLLLGFRPLLWRGGKAWRQQVVFTAVSAKPSGDLLPDYSKERKSDEKRDLLIVLDGNLEGVIETK